MVSNEWITPINKRIKELPERNENSLVRSVKCVMPVAVYYFLNMFLTYGAAYAIGTGQYGAKTSRFFLDHSVGVALAIRIAVVVLSALPLFFLFCKENPILVQSEATGGKDKISFIAYTILLATCLSLFLNVMFVKLGISGMSSTYEATSTKQFSLSLGAGLLMYGICTPIAEEIVYRGLVYNRLRRYFEMPLPMIIAPLLFGIAHGNIVQLLYGFIMGFVICFIYERYGSFIYPVLFHVFANSAVYTVIKYEPLKDIFFSVPATVLTGIASIVLFSLILINPVSRDK